VGGTELAILKVSESQKQISNISKSLTQADNQLHSIIQGYMTYIEENYSVHALLLKIKTDSNLYLPHTPKITPEIYYGSSRILQNSPDSLKNISNTQCNQWQFQQNCPFNLSVIR
jgi:hypothetical protein